MKYSRYVFVVTAWPNPGEDMVETTVVVELTANMTEAMRIAIEDWQPKTQGEIRSIAVKDITGIDRPDEALHNDGYPIESPPEEVQS